MNRSIRIAAIAIAALTLSACVEDTATREAPYSRSAGSNAESACMAKVNFNYGGKVKDLRVTSSSDSEANAMVMITAIGVRGTSQSEQWKCLVSRDGQVQELSVVQ
jgi:hypothetical protein